MSLKKLCQNIVLSSIGCLSLVLTSATLRAELASSGTLAPSDYQNGVLAFEDNFLSGQPLDTDVWDVTDNQYKKPSNVSASGGYLRLKTTQIDPNNPLDQDSYTTGEVGTSKFWQRFGYWETRLRIGTETGLNNAFWLNTPVPELFTSRDRLEIDIQEIHNHQDTGNDSNDELNMGVHDWAPTHRHAGPPIVQQDSLDLSASFHKYALEWKTTNELVWYFDGVQVGQLNSWELDDYKSFIPLQTLFSTKVLTWAGNPLSLNLDGTEMTVDWVRAYQKDGWVGDGTTSAKWATSSNWGPDGEPSSQEVAVFNTNTSSTTVDLEGIAQTAKELYFTGDVPGLTFTGTSGAELKVGDNNGQLYGGAITLNNDVQNNQDITVQVRAVAPLTLANYTPAGDGIDLNLNRRLYNDGHDVTVEGTGNIKIGWAVKGTGSLTKWGEGRLTLTSSASDYSGGTFVNEGILRADGNLTGTADVIVTRGSGASFATLEGDGSIAGKIEVDDWARLSPGNGGVGTLTVNNDVEIFGNGRLNIEVDDSASDLLIVEDLDLSSTSDRLDLDFIGTGSYQSEYTIVQYSGTLTGTFNTLEGLTESYVVDYGSGTNSVIKLIYNGVGGVPEPSTTMLLLLGMLSVGSRRSDGRRHRGRRSDR